MKEKREREEEELYNFSGKMARGGQIGRDGWIKENNGK
jgi:hypothetical protein